MKRSAAPSRSPLKRGTKPIPRRKKLSAKGKARRARLKVEKRERSERAFARKYHSLERVRFVMSLPCSACSYVGDSENAHLLGNDGMGRKKGFETIGPLCHARGDYPGCHRLYDRHRDLFDKTFPKFQPVAVTIQTEVAWRAFSEGET